MVTVTDLEVNPIDRLLIAGTFGRGSYTWPLNALVTHVEDVAVPSAFDLSAPYPNPFTDRLQMEFDIEMPGEVRFLVSDILGRTVHEDVVSATKAGRHTWTWTPQNQAAGPYFVTASSGSRQVSRPVIRVR